MAYDVGDEEIRAAADVLRSKRLMRYLKQPQGLFSQVDCFEQELARVIGVPHALAVNSGTSALICALAAFGVGPEDEVIVPGYTFMATPQAPLALGAIPILAEVDESLTIDVEDVRRKITPRTKAIIPVHMQGHPCELEPLLELAREKKLLVIEDACQAIGGSYRGRRLGSLGDAGVYSFNHFKIIAFGEGGAVVLKDEQALARARCYHDVGGWLFRPRGSMPGSDPVPARPAYEHPRFCGQNYRIAEVQGAILRVQLGRLESILAQLRRRKAVLLEVIAAAGACELTPIRDREGECATGTFVRFENQEQTLRFAQLLGPGSGVLCDLPYHSDRHVYWDWTPILEKRGAHVQAWDPFHVTEAGRAVRYDRDMLPQTRRHLACTAHVHTGYDGSDEEWEAAVRRVAQAAAKAATRGAVGVAAVPSRASAGPSPSTPSSRVEARPAEADLPRVKAAVVGFGTQGVIHLRQLIATGLYDVVGVADPTPRRRSTAESMYGLRAFSTLEELLERVPDVELVVIAAHSAVHFSLALTAVRAGKHIVVEKPFTLDGREAEEVMRLAADRGLLATAFHNFRWLEDPDYLKVKGLVSRGAIGEVFFLSIHDGHPTRAQEYGTEHFDPGWRVERSAGGGALLDYGPHRLDQVLDLLPEKVVKVAAQVRSLKWGTADDFFDISLTFEGGARATINHSALSPYSPSPWLVYGKEGTIEGGGERPIVGWTKDKRLQPKVSPLPPDTYHRNYFDVLRKKGEEPIIKPAEVLRGMRLLDAVRQASAEARTLEVEI